MTISELIERLDRHVMPEPNSGCWIWLGAMQSGGYGSVWFGNRTERVHRVSWIAHFGEIPERLCVCHRCDVRLCINPEHLFLGTLLENNQDRHVKGRDFIATNRAAALGILAKARSHVRVTPSGTINANARLREEDIPAIRAAFAEGVSTHELARRYGVTQPTMWRVTSGKGWQHVK